MSSSNSDIDPSWSEISTKSNSMSDGDKSTSGSSESLGHVASHIFSYDDEPLAEVLLGETQLIFQKMPTEYHQLY